MFVYSWTNVSAAAEGGIEKRHRCEKCKTWYCYDMERRIDAGRHIPFSVGVDEAAREVQVEVRDSLRDRLREEVDSVPCPNCGWIQTQMVEQLRAEKFGWLRQFPLLYGLGSLVAIPLVYLIFTMFLGIGPPVNGVWTLWPVAPASVLVLTPGVLIWYLGRARRVQFDPNVSRSLESRLRQGRWQARVIDAPTTVEMPRRPLATGNN